MATIVVNMSGLSRFLRLGGRISDTRVVEVVPRLRDGRRRAVINRPGGKYRRQTRGPQDGRTDRCGRRVDESGGER